MTDIDLLVNLTIFFIMNKYLYLYFITLECLKYKLSEIAKIPCTGIIHSHPKKFGFGFGFWFVFGFHTQTHIDPPQQKKIPKTRF